VPSKSKRLKDRCVKSIDLFLGHFFKRTRMKRSRNRLNQPYDG